MSERSPADLAARVDAARFDAWYRERRRRENARNGRFHRNVPGEPPPEDVLFPSSLLQCHRKQYYRERDAPAERRSPAGHFRFGTWVETTLVLPFLEESVSGSEEYVRNSLGFEARLETPTGPIRLRGSTDPIVTTVDGTIVLPTEVKTVGTLSGSERPTSQSDRPTSPSDLPKEHHRAQLHAYLRALEVTEETTVSEGLVIYVAKDTLEMQSLLEPFDEEFWRDRVVPWMAAHRRYRSGFGLPPATPEQSWECDYCEFRHRCGKTDLPVANAAPEGFVPTHRYPRTVVEFHLQKPDAALTPTLADAYPDLAAANPVAEWVCGACGERMPYGQADGDGRRGERPACPSCGSDGDFGPLAGPKPDRLPIVEG